jgi:hypothetical protein
MDFDGEGKNPSLATESVGALPTHRCLIYPFSVANSDETIPEE